MKPVLHAVILFLAGLTACSTTRNEQEIEEFQYDRILTLPTEDLANQSGSTLKELHVGFGVWVRECGKCHDHVFPEDVSSKDWHIMTPKMAWNANITDAEQDALLKYILASKENSNRLGKHLRSMNAATP